MLWLEVDASGEHPAQAPFQLGCLMAGDRVQLHGICPPPSMSFVGRNELGPHSGTQLDSDRLQGIGQALAIVYTYVKMHFQKWLVEGVTEH